VGILEEDIARVRAATDAVAVISEHVALKRVGRNYSGLCPFHSEKSGSFNVSPDKGTYYCFGCQAKGDVISFVREIEHLDFSAAIEKLASKANITLRYDTESATKDRLKRAKLLEATEKATEWYHQRLLTSPDAGAARKYLRSRGFDREAISHFRIGWAPEGWDTLCKSLTLPADVARDTGLGYVSKIGKLNDFFQSRILFPIFDTQGNPIAFGGRKMPEAEGPKYKNSSETKLYAKSRVLYGLNWAKSQIVEKGEVIVCEGYTDVIAFHRSGMPRAVATCGTALADEHFQILKNFARRIVLAYDADAAGQNAAEKFYAWERKYEIDLFVVALPPGEDPAELAQHNPERLQEAVANAQPFLRFRLERLLAKANLSSLEGRARAFEAAVAIAFEHPSAVVREQYLNDVALRCQVSTETVAAVLSDPTRYLPGASSGAAKSSKSTGTGGRKLPTRSTRDGRESTFTARPTPSETPPSPSANSSSRPNGSKTSAMDHSESSGRVIANEPPPDFGPPDDGRYGPGDSYEPPSYDSPRSFGNESSNGYNQGGQGRTAGRAWVPNAKRPPQPDRQAVASNKHKGRASSATTVAKASMDRATAAELEAMRWVLADPARVVPWLEASFFANPLLRSAFELAVEEPDLAAGAELVASRGDDPEETKALDLLYQLAVESPTHEADDAVSRVVGNATNRAIADLAAVAASGINDDTVDVGAVAHLKRLQDKLHDSDIIIRTEALGLLVPWLAAWGRRT
jgi:DNA primase